MEHTHRIRRAAASVAATGVAAALLLASAGPAGAVGPHAHVVSNPAGSHDIARGFCNGNFAEGSPANVAIENFHSLIHVGPAGPDGVVTISAHGC